MRHTCTTRPSSASRQTKLWPAAAACSAPQPSHRVHQLPALLHRPVLLQLATLRRADAASFEPMHAAASDAARAATGNAARALRHAVPAPPGEPPCPCAVFRRQGCTASNATATKHFPEESYSQDREHVGILTSPNTQLLACSASE